MLHYWTTLFCLYTGEHIIYSYIIVQVNADADAAAAGDCSINIILSEVDDDVNDDVIDQARNADRKKR